jgi:hypothetical protein
MAITYNEDNVSLGDLQQHHDDFANKAGRPTALLVTEDLEAEAEDIASRMPNRTPLPVYVVPGEGKQWGLISAGRTHWFGPKGSAPKKRKSDEDRANAANEAAQRSAASRPQSGPNDVTGPEGLTRAQAADRAQRAKEDADNPGATGGPTPEQQDGAKQAADASADTPARGKRK